MAAIVSCQSLPSPLETPIPSLISFYKLQQCHLLHAHTHTHPAITTAVHGAFNLFAVERNRTQAEVQSQHHGNNNDSLSCAYYWLSAKKVSMHKIFMA